jgi:hypothetical protein
VGKAFRREDEVVLDRDDLAGPLEGDVFTERVGDEMRAHAREVVVREPPIRGNEHALARRELVLRNDLAPGDDLFHQRARAHIGRQRCNVNAVHARQLRLAVLQQAAGTDDVLRDLVPPRGKGRKRYRFAPGDPFEDGEIGSGEDADVVAVLAVDALEAFGNDQPDARRFLRKRAGFPRGALAVPLASDQHLESTAVQRVDADRHLAFHLEGDVRVTGEPLVVVEAHRGRRDLVGRDVVAQRHALREREIGAAQLPAHRLEAFRQEQGAAGEADHGVHRDRSTQCIRPLIVPRTRGGLPSRRAVKAGGRRLRARIPLRRRGIQGRVHANIRRGAPVVARGCLD